MILIVAFTTVRRAAHGYFIIYHTYVFTEQGRHKTSKLCCLSVMRCTWASMFFFLRLFLPEEAGEGGGRGSLLIYIIRTRL